MDRIPLICPSRQTELVESFIEPGVVRKLSCQAVAVSAPGESLPNCPDREFTNDILLGLVTCL